MQKLFTKAFWKFASERAVSNIAEVAVAMLGVNAMTTGLDILKVDWAHVGSVSLGAGIVSVLLSIRAYK
jgi:hypothetical protein